MFSTRTFRKYGRANAPLARGSVPESWETAIGEWVTLHGLPDTIGTPAKFTSKTVYSYQGVVTLEIEEGGKYFVFVERNDGLSSQASYETSVEIENLVISILNCDVDKSGSSFLVGVDAESKRSVDIQCDGWGNGGTIRVAMEEDWDAAARIIRKVMKISRRQSNVDLLDDELILYDFARDHCEEISESEEITCFPYIHLDYDSGARLSLKLIRSTGKITVAKKDSRKP